MMHGGHGKLDMNSMVLMISPSDDRVFPFKMTGVFSAAFGRHECIALEFVVLAFLLRCFSRQRFPAIGRAMHVS
jgi:hypothetical protein